MSSYSENINSRQILVKLLESIEHVNFKDYANLLDAKSTLKKKHFLVSVIEILLKKSNQNKFSLCRKNDMIYLFNGQYWEHVENDLFKDFLGEVALKTGVDKFDAKLHQFKDELLKQFISDARLKEITSKNDTTIINLKNGTFEINANKQYLRAFDKRDFLTYQLPFAYDVNAEAPIFNKFLNQALPEKELQLVLSEFLGYIFIKNDVLKLEKALLLFGAGANGKSVLFEIICALLGSENYTGFSLQSLTDDKGYSRAMLTNKLLNYSSEISGKLESSIFKQLCSGEPVEARLPYGNPKIIKDYARFMFNCNALPNDAENTHAYFRRFIIIPFNITVETNQQDKDLSKKIINSELSGVFNFVIDGLKRLLKNKNFTESRIIKEQIHQYEIDSDSVFMFLEDNNYEKSNSEILKINSIYTEYTSFCHQNGVIPYSTKTFSQRLEKRGFKKSRNRSFTFFYIQKKVFN